MASPRSMIACCLLTFGSLAATSLGYAEPLTVQVLVTSGSMSFPANGSPGWGELFGTGFQFIGNADVMFDGPRPCTENPCEQGRMVDYSTSAAGPARGHLSYGNLTWELEDTGFAEFAFTAPPLILPEVPDPDPWNSEPGLLGRTTLSAPFTFLGTVQNMKDANPEDISFHLSGQGTASATFQGYKLWDPSGESLYTAWHFEFVTYEFTKPSEPVPEPASLLLFAGGLAWIARRGVRHQCDT